MPNRAPRFAEVSLAETGLPESEPEPHVASAPHSTFLAQRKPMSPAEKRAGMEVHS